MKKKSLLKAKLVGIFLALVVCSGIFACFSFDETSDISRRDPNPHYLLNGSEIIPESGNFVYYSLGNNKYAIGLKDTARNNTGTIDIPEYYNGDENKPITGIYHDGFRSSKYSTVNLTRNITIIDYEAFIGSKITTITIPDTVTDIGEAAFYSCRNLTNVRINNSSASAADSSSACACGTAAPSGDTHYSDLDEIPAFCFFNCVELVDVMLPSKIETIGYEAFNGCSKLASFFSFTKLKAIYARAFQGCSSLEKMYIPSIFFDGGTGIIEPLAFNHCSSTLYFYFSASDYNASASPKSTLVNNWLTAHPDWGRYNENNNSKYGTSNYEINGGSITFSEDWRYETKNGEVTIQEYIGPTQIGGKDIVFLNIPDNLPIGSENKVCYINPAAFNQVRKIIQRLYLPKTLKKIENKMFNYISMLVNGKNTNVYFEKLVVIDDNTRCSYDTRVEEIDVLVQEIDDKGNNATSEELTQKVALLAEKEAIRDVFYEKRIRLDQLTNLKIVGDEAFINLKKLDQIEQLYLPYSIEAIGNYAFGKQGNNNNNNNLRMKGVRDFQWIYDETIDEETGKERSCLKMMGRDAFFKLGNKDDFTDIDNLVNGQSSYNFNPQIAADGTQNYKTTTLVLPRSFSHTGVTDNDKTGVTDDGNIPYGFTVDAGNNGKSGDHAFGGCPLISKVIIKGSKEDTLTNSGISKDSNVDNLILGGQTFALCESLRTIVIEERKGRSVVFHTQSGSWTQPCIGWNGAKNKTDFSGCPLLQTLVLPTQYTTLRIQNLAFQGNPRGVIYLSGGDGTDEIKGSATGNKEQVQKIVSNPAKNETAITNIKKWKLIGDESYCNIGQNNASKSYGYIGYCFAPDLKTDTDSTNVQHFGIDQQMPVYTNVHYKEVLNSTEELKYIRKMETVHNDETGEDEIVNRGVTVELGKYLNYHADTKERNKKDLVIVDGEHTDDELNTINNGKFAVLCDTENSRAIMTKYLYDRIDNTFSGTAKVPHQVTAYKVKDTDTATYTVKEIGKSAFSAAYCDDASYSSSYKELTKVMVPDTVDTIEEYAFMRAYGVTNVCSYDVSTKASNGDYVMPSSLDYIGKHAFAFCNIEQILKIKDTCTFYENKAATSDYETSCFINNFALRRITFGSNNATSSTYYKTTTYTSKRAGTPTFTTAIYSTKATDVAGKFTANKNRLLLVLYRDTEDKLLNSYTSEDTSKTTITTTNDSVKFDGKYQINGEPQSTYLYGAYKMAYWVDDLVLGTPTSTTKNQPIVSGLVDRATSKSKVIYLNFKADDFKNIICDMKQANFTTLSIQPYAFAGCEQLEKIGLPQAEGETLPAGLFESVENTVKFTVPNNDAGTSTTTCAAGVLDLTYTKYDGIAADAFANSGITSFIAPKTTGVFHVAESAFENCDSLASVDFSNVQGTVTIDANAFKDCDNLTTLDFSSTSNTATVVINASAFESCDRLATIDCSGCTSVTIGSNGFKDCDALANVNFAGATTLAIGDYAFNSATIKDSTGTGITWPSSNSAAITFGNYSFTKCVFESHTFTLPHQLLTLGTHAFDGCSTLQTLTADGNLSITTIGNASFLDCTNLNNFDFDKFPALTTIGDGAFKIMSSSSNNATICTGGIVELPDTVASIGPTAFQNSKITEVYIQTADVVTIGANAFKNCTALKFIYFNVPTTGGWLPATGETGQFDGCGSAFKELWITGNGFNINYSTSASLINGDTAVVIYTHTKFSDSIQVNNSTWREYDSTNHYKREVMCFYVETVTDLITDNGDSTYSLAINTQNVGESNINFWMWDPNGSGTLKSNVITLGYITNYDSATGVITFSSGYTLAGDGTLTAPVAP